MKGSLLIFISFIVGVCLAYAGLLPDFLLDHKLSTYALYLMIILVGVGMGSELKQSLKLIQTMKLRILLIPFATVVGTLIGSSLFPLLVGGINLQDSLAIGSGLGYYSLSSIYIKEMRGETLGAIALLANLSRELLSLLLIPFLARYFGKLAPIASAGATSMDTCLPVISQAVGKQYVLLSVFSGTVLSLLVPFLVTFILSL